jgi:hypothetical protein
MEIDIGDPVRHDQEGHDAGRDERQDKGEKHEPSPVTRGRVYAANAGRLRHPTDG